MNCELWNSVPIRPTCPKLPRLTVAIFFPLAPSVAISLLSLSFSRCHANGIVCINSRYRWKDNFPLLSVTPFSLFFPRLFLILLLLLFSLPPNKLWPAKTINQGGQRFSFQRFFFLLESIITLDIIHAVYSREETFSKKTNKKQTQKNNNLYDDKKRHYYFMLMVTDAPDD